MSDTPLTEIPGGVRIAVWVVPGASRSVIDGEHGGHIKVRVASPPEDGRANDEVADLLAETLGGGVELKSGMRSRSKVFEVIPAELHTVRRKLGV